jgi:hypothetical protein
MKTTPKLKPWHYGPDGKVPRPPEHVMQSNGPFVGQYTQARKAKYLEQKK